MLYSRHDPSCVLQDDDAPTPYDILVGSLPHQWEEDTNEEASEVDSHSEMVCACVYEVWLHFNCFSISE